MIRTRLRHYENYVNMVRKLAWQYSTHSTTEFSELESEGFLVFHHCTETFDPTKRKSNFGAYLWQNLHYRFKSICYPQQQHTMTWDPEWIERAVPATESADEKYFDLHELLTSLTAEAQEVIQTIFDCPAELLELWYESPHYTRRTAKAAYKGGFTKGAVLSYLRHLGWKRCHVVRAFDEITQALRGV